MFSKQLTAHWRDAALVLTKDCAGWPNEGVCFCPIAFCRIAFFLALLPVLSLAAETPSVPFAWGITGHTFGQEAYRDISAEQQLDLVESLGLGWYRVDVSPAILKQEETWRRFLSEARQRHIQILPVLFPSLGIGDGASSLEDLERDAFTSGEAFARFFQKEVTYYELQNELDNYAILTPAPNGDSPAHYDEVRYQRALAQIRGLAAGVRSVSPESRLIVNSAGWYHYGFLQRLVADGLRFDILGWHWYSDMGDMAERGILSKIKAFGLPIWITEINRRNGSEGGSEAEQAAYLSGAVAAYVREPGIEAFFAYELLDEPYFQGGESAYGLVTVKKESLSGRWMLGEKKPGFDAFQKAMDLARKH